MGELLSYFIVSGLVLLTMYLAYKLFIAKENQPKFNRLILLSMYLVSFCAWPTYDMINSRVTDSPLVASITITEFKTQAIEPISQQPIWGTILIWIFLIGALIVTIKTVVTWIGIAHVVRNGERIKKNDYTLVVIDNDKIAPFSWMRYVVINRNDLNKYDEVISIHELRHIRSLHWLDLLIAQIVCIVNWFNPAAWLMREELILVHEYQADMAVIESGHDPKEYQMLLIKKAVGYRFPSLANSINHSKLKKRITMMYKSKSGAGSKFKALALVPMVALALVLTNVPAVKSAVTTIGESQVSLHKDSENLAQSPQYRVTSMKVKSDAQAPADSATMSAGEKSVQYKVTSLKVKTDAPSTVKGANETSGYAENQSSNPQFKIVSLNNSGQETTVVVKGEGLGNNLTVSGGTFTNKGKTYSANSLNANMENGNVVITSVFPESDNYENASISLNINGKTVTLQLEEFRKAAQHLQASISTSNGIVIYNGNATLSTVGNMEIYLDGKKISEDEMKALDPRQIKSMEINNQTNSIYINTK